MRARPVFIMRRRLLSLPLLLVVLVLSYVFLCDRAEQLGSLSSGKKVTLVGFVTDVFPSSGQSRNTVYKLRDLTGEAYLVSQKNPPREGTVLIVWGVKGETDTGRAILIEKNRVGDFLWRVILFLTHMVDYLFGI